jgi:hypothetical protein
VLTVLAAELPQVRTLALTLHGPGSGLDEGEAFTSELAGVADAVISGSAPPDLERVTLVERDPRRAQRLAARLAQVLPEGTLAPQRRGIMPLPGPTMPLGLAGAGSKAKPYVFVAMPFADEFDDVYH